MNDHPVFRRIVDSYVDIETDMEECARRLSGDVALQVLALQRAAEDMSLEDRTIAQVAIRNIERAILLYSNEGGRPNPHLLSRFIEGVREAISLIDRGQQANAHSLNDKEVRQKVWELTGGRCTYCDCQLENGGTVGASFVVEHVVPRSCGGPDNIANYVPACASCNNSKGDRHVLQFIQTKMDRRRPPLTVVPLPVAVAE